MTIIKLNRGKKILNRLCLEKSRLSSMEVVFDHSAYAALNLQILVHKDDIKQLEKLVNDYYKA